jgi:hypothetical protein
VLPLHPSQGATQPVSQPCLERVIHGKPPRCTQDAMTEAEVTGR